MTRSTSARRLELVRLAYGMALLGCPAQLATAVTGTPASGTTVTVMRVLGARHVIQAALTVGSRSGRVRTLAAAVDLAHLASLGPIAALCDSRDRRLVAGDAVLEASFAVAERRHNTRG